MLREMKKTEKEKPHNVSAKKRKNTKRYQKYIFCGGGRKLFVDFRGAF